MVNPVIKDGVLILFNSTLGASQDCCCPVGTVSEEYEPCICPETCATLGEFVNPPSIQLTVFDADYAGGDIVWCGETWTQAQVQAGDSRCVCPTSYSTQKDFSTSPATVSGNANYATWRFNSDLQMSRYVLFSQFTPVPTTFLKAQFVRLTWNDGGAVTDRRGKIQNFFTTGPPTGPAFYTNTSALGVFNPTNPAYDATANDYNIIDQQFGSHTTGGGVQYSWQRGARWN